MLLNESFSYKELYYDKANHSYKLSGSKIESIDRMEATVISKIILESGLLRKDETVGLLGSLFKAVTTKDEITVNNYVSADLDKYNSKTDVAVLKFVEDLYVVINSGYDIKITTSGKKCSIVQNISPLEIKCKNKEFVLLAAENFDLNHLIEIKIKDILHFENLHSIYAKTIKEKYNGEIKNGKG